MANLTVSGNWISLVRIRAISSSEIERPSKLNRDLVKGSGLGVGLLKVALGIRVDPQLFKIASRITEKSTWVTVFINFALDMLEFGLG